MTDVIMVYILRMGWALVLAYLLLADFRASYNAEYKGKRGWPWKGNDDSLVWMDPIYFPVIILVYVIACIILGWWKNSDGRLISSVVDLFFFVSVYFTLLLFLLPVLRKYFMARTCAAFWLIPVFLFYQPHQIYLTTALPPAVYFYIPGKLLKILLCLWIVGGIIIFGIQVIFHLKFIWKLKRNSRLVQDLFLLRKWEEAKEKLDYNAHVELRISPAVQTPLSVGMRKKKKITYLPEQDYSEEDLEFIFCHELHHIQRNDMHTKFFLRFCNALGWIHPFVWLAIRKAEDDLELSCDEVVLKDADGEKRKKYAQLLLSTAGRSEGFTTCLSASAKTMRYRLKSVMQERKKILGSWVLFVVMIFSSFCAGRTMLVTERGSVAELTETKSWKIAEADVQNRDYEKVSRIDDVEEFFNYLSDLKVEKCVIPYEEYEILDSLWISGEFENGSISFTLADRYLNIYNGEDGLIETYHICDSSDAEYKNLQQKFLK